MQQQKYIPPHKRGGFQPEREQVATRMRIISPRTPQKFPSLTPRPCHGCQKVNYYFGYTSPLHDFCLDCYNGRNDPMFTKFGP